MPDWPETDVFTFAFNGTDGWPHTVRIQINQMKLVIENLKRLNDTWKKNDLVHVAHIAFENQVKCIQCNNNDTKKTLSISSALNRNEKTKRSNQN